VSWVRLDDAFFDNPKLAEHGMFAPLCGWQLVCILGYCNRYLTDGLIPKAKAHSLVAWEHVGVMTGGEPGLYGVGHDVEGKELCELLADCGHLEEPDEWTYLVHDYLDYQPSRAQVLTERSATAKRQAEWRERRRNGASNVVSNGVSNAAPVPVPVPVPRVKSPKGESSSRRTAENDHTAELAAFTEAWNTSCDPLPRLRKPPAGAMKVALVHQAMAYFDGDLTLLAAAVGRAAADAHYRESGYGFEAFCRHVERWGNAPVASSVSRSDKYADAPRFGPSPLAAAYIALDNAHTPEAKELAKAAIREASK
jgi:hypothetical protein